MAITNHSINGKWYRTNRSINGKIKSQQEMINAANQDKSSGGGRISF
jgi:hypothetical protein